MRCASRPLLVGHRRGPSSTPQKGGFHVVPCFVALLSRLRTHGSARARRPGGRRRALTQIMVDPFTNASSQHKTVAEPDTFSFGSTIVSVAQEGRFFDGGASDIGFATSKNNGASW